MKINELIPGMLLQPHEGYVWLVVPWKGSDGVVVGHYLKVVSERYSGTEDTEARIENVLFLGDASTLPKVATPGRQVVLAWGEKMTVDPSSWKRIKASS